MRWMSLAIAACAFVFTLSLSPPATADVRDEIAAATREWSDAFSAHDIDRIMKLYSRDALLWGTNARALRSTTNEIVDFYKSAFNMPNLTVSFDNQTIRVFGNVAVAAGNYTFSAGPDNQQQDRPSRYSFTFIKDGERWMIIDHNSAPMPTPPVRSQRT
jgi:uncharacterized protein (TIGR02246 family)